DVDECAADRLRFLEAHEGVLGMVLVLDAVEEIAKVAPEVAGLPEPEDSPAGYLPRRAERVEGLGRRRGGDGQLEPRRGGRRRGRAHARATVRAPRCGEGGGLAIAAIEPRRSAPRPRETTRQRPRAARG